MNTNTPSTPALDSLRDLISWYIRSDPDAALLERLTAGERIQAARDAADAVLEAANPDRRAAAIARMDAGVSDAPH